MRLVLLQPRLRAFDTAHNLREIRALLRDAGSLEGEDLVLLPEHAIFTSDAEKYTAHVAELSVECGCAVAGGSHHRSDGDEAVNTGSIVSPRGDVLCTYEKLRPYSEERRMVRPGTRLGECTLHGVRILVLVCADFWFSDLYSRAAELPDLVLVPALSVTRKAGPEYSRTLWRHMAVARAYEFGVYIGVSDWDAEAELPRLRTSGVGGFADPTTQEPSAFHRPIADGILTVDIDLVALEAFRRDRIDRGFYWKHPGRSES
jgi:predicted amidohydrolase